MKKLLQTFTTGKADNKVLFNQVHRTDNTAIYMCNSNNPDGTLETYYEVFKIKISKPSKFKTKDGNVIVYQESERYVKDEDFGRHAWTTRDFDEAYHIYNTIK